MSDTGSGASLALDATARRFAAARRHAECVAVATLVDAIKSADEAYRIQDAVARELGWFTQQPPRAWKTGAPSRAAVPIAAPIPSVLVRGSPARFAASDFHGIGIEAEIALRLRLPLPATEATAPGFDWTRVVGEIVAGIEIVDSRLDDPVRAPPFVKLADFQQNGAYVVGTGIRCDRAPDWSSLRARVRRNGAVIAETAGGHPLGDPTCLLPWLVRHVEARGWALCAGDLVTLGTWAGIVPAAAGERIDVAFEGIGQASVEFA